MKWLYQNYVKQAVLHKQPLADVLKKFEIFTIRQTPVLESLFDKVASLKPATLLKRDPNTGVFL